ncbi:DUF2141 domain-containing protein [Palleronia sediminis]|uniref:DUF2141 domain-containing protein n=1 Tax=Palleronia sediminis TaxID=2547833 RepID=A0A4R6A925_9RHOB|nr:DUF2141 domain-containing protein [Palleronia sediminis]TDL77706.1 DUF2141 domain-containing protein [Palleronia sediminis]
MGNPTAWLAIAACAATPCFAGDVRVTVSNLRSDAGLLRVALCSEENFTRPTCQFTGARPASERMVVLRGVPDGVYAVQAFHDEDGDGDLDRRGFRPSEGLGFSRDAPMRRGPPRFGDAAIRVNGDGTVPITIRYYQ